MKYNISKKKIIYFFNKKAKFIRKNEFKYLMIIILEPLL